ncbi:hypothetical protein ACQI4F_19980 [Mycolicibacterium vaccae]|uniref:hypothetical protein n=1 Tax=Mycolicibacterium vaccae TaxID=1810 RepID=UPI003CE94ED6
MLRFGERVEEVVSQIDPMLYAKAVQSKDIVDPYRLDEICQPSSVLGEADSNSWV